MRGALGGWKRTWVSDIACNWRSTSWMKIPSGQSTGVESSSIHRTLSASSRTPNMFSWVLHNSMTSRPEHARSLDCKRVVLHSFTQFGVLRRRRHLKKPAEDVTSGYMCRPWPCRRRFHSITLGIHNSHAVKQPALNSIANVLFRHDIAFRYRSNLCLLITSEVISHAIRENLLCVFCHFTSDKCHDDLYECLTIRLEMCVTCLMRDDCFLF